MHQFISIIVGYGRGDEERLANYGETGVAEPLFRKTPSLSINQPGSGGFPARWQSHSYALWVLRTVWLLAPSNWVKLFSLQYQWQLSYKDSGYKKDVYP